MEILPVALQEAGNGSLVSQSGNRLKACSSPACPCSKVAYESLALFGSTAADAQVQHPGQRNLRVPAGPRTATDSSRTAFVAAALQAQVRQHAVHGLNAVRRAQDGQEEGGVGSPLRLQRHVHADVQRVLLTRLRLKHQRRQLLRAYFMTPEATRLLGWSAARSPSASSCCGPARPGSSAFLPRRALSVLPQAALERLCAKPARRWPVLLPQRLAPPPQHLVLLRQLSDPGLPP